MSMRAVCLSLALCCGLQATDLGLVRVGEVWRWRAVASAGAPVPANWIAPDFEDAAWPGAVSGLGADPYAAEASALGGVPPAGPICLRAHFTLEDPATVAWLALRVDWSGGFIAFVNGAEIARRNLPGSPGEPVDFAVLPQARTKGAAELIDCPAGVAALRPGENVLAIQWHPPPGSYGSGIVPELIANFTRGPFLQNTTTTSQSIAWRTPVPADTVVEYGESPALGRRVTDSSPGTNHLATLTDLLPDTQYYYRVGSSDGPRTAASPILGFRTSKSAGPVRFMVVADTGGGSRWQYKLAEVMRAAAPDFVHVNGDLVYPAFSEGLADQRFFSVYRRQMTDTPFFVSAGNHDTLYSPPQQFFDAFHLPTNTVPAAEHALAGTGPEHYYSFDAGDAHFAVLYAPLYYRGLEITEGSPQWRWLDSDLAGSAKPWKFIFLHLPLMSSGPHGEDDYNYNGVADTEELARVLLPLAARHRVQMVFSAHDHAYERFHPVQGVQCIVSGGGGGNLYALDSRRRESAQFHYRWHGVIVDIAGDALQLRGVDADGVLFDEMFLQRTPPAAREHSAAWHTPSSAAEAASDGDGNRVGQRFDFLGEPIPTAPGESSNLGRVWVNQDHRELHVGFERVMIPDHANMFLFLESPATAGVTTMAGLGNGLVDPTGEGADGLDFLENLSFKNFQPAIACVLGDEFADGQFRSFQRTNIVPVAFGPPLVRTNLVSDIGQGVFRLNAQFTDVAGARLEQFNRSPQTDVVEGEQNADFIVVSLPLAALGLHGGELIKLGAVVGVGEFASGPATGARWLDRSFLGASLAGFGTGQVVLEGMPVRLGPDLDPDDDGLSTPEEMALGTQPEQADSDGDGLPDGWEVRHGLDPLSPEGTNGASGDPDGDGFANAAEFAAGTRPNDAASALRLSARPLAGGGIEFRWPAIPGRSYALEWAAAPGAEFHNLDEPGLPRTAVAPWESYSLAGRPDGDAARFFRLRLLP